MHHNIMSYWRHLQNLQEGHCDLPSPRVCRLMSDMFERWQNQQAFPAWDCFGHVRDHVPATVGDIMVKSIAVRRGHAMSATLTHLIGPWGQKQGFSWVHPDELIVGTMPPYSVGQGKEIMRYLSDAEELESEIRFLNGWSNFGHIAPNHERVVRQGLRQIINDCSDKQKASTNERERDFYASVVVALNGVIAYAEGYADLAKKQALIHEELIRTYPQHPTQALFEERIATMNAVSERLRRIPAEPCSSFTDAVQCIYLMNCALHWTGELTSLGRLDQILEPYYREERLSFDAAQEVIECLWVKLDERVMLNHRHFVDRFSSADGALLGGGGASNFDQGALANQWMQQVTIGGVKATNDAKAEDASNDITRMCLTAARRLPFNCPTVDLRVHKKTPRDLLELAADAILSGGAHPVLMNDDKLVPALHKDSGGAVELASARNYACDGCYETIFPGETEFSFFYVPGVDVLEKALNSGAGFASSGATNLRGAKGSYRSPPADQIRTYEQFYEILEKHIWINVNRQFGGVLAAYGCKGPICPSPLLSAMIDGCLESGRDLYNGGARYHMFAPLMTGISTVADSLFAIKHLVFEQKRFSLEQLVACLRSNWGQRQDVIGLKLSLVEAASIREQCLQLPKFGSGNSLVDEFAWKLIYSFVDAVDRARKHPLHQSALQRLRDQYGTPQQPFEILLTPGVGTFEQYVFGGVFAGATPDGRTASAPLASDLAASPVPPDRYPILRDDKDPQGPLYARQFSLLNSFSSWNNSAVNRLSDGAPSDFNIREDFPRGKLIQALRAFADGKGSNIMTVTVANPETLRNAEARPDDYNLVRVRMGGWTEYFSVLFGDHKAQQRRRPIYTP